MVLQRWQTVYLFIAVIALALTLFMPVFEVFGIDGTANGISLCSLIGGVTTGTVQLAYVYFILTAVSAVMSLVTIFKFKNLKLQKSLCSVIMLLIIVAYVVIAVCSNLTGGFSAVKWDLASLMPAFALICVFLAKTRITHDYNLIHAADRLR